MLAIVIIAGSIVAAITFLNPRAGAYIFWTLYWCYPTSALHALLPLNMRFDDLFLLYLTLCCLRVAPPDVLASRTFRIALVWFLAIVFGNIVGVLTGPDYLLTAVIRFVGKSAYVPMVAIVINTVVRNEQDCRRMLIAMGLAAFGSTAIGVVQVRAPELVSIWEVPHDDPSRRLLSETGGIELADETRRASGSQGLNPLAVMGASMVAIGLRIAVNVATSRAKLGASLLMAIGGTALGYTISRGATTGLAVAMLYSLVRFPKRTATLAVIVVGVVLLLSTTDLGQRWGQRVSGEGIESPLGESAQVRGSLWRLYLEEFSPHYLLFGRGFNAEFVRHGTSVHNTYIGAFAYTGLFGAIVQTWMVFSVFILGSRLARIEHNPLFRALGEALVMLMIALLVHGVASELLQAFQPVLFTVFAIVDMRLRAHERGEAAAEFSNWPPADDPTHANPVFSGVLPPAR